MLRRLERWATVAFAAIFVGPVARLTIRLMAWRLIVRRIKPAPIGRNEALATATKTAAAGRCAACGSFGPLEADHYRPRWAGGPELASNYQALCFRCHDAKTGAEAKVRAHVRRLRFRNGSGALNPGVVPGHRWLLVGLAGLGAVDGAFDVFGWPVRVGVIIAFAIGLRWQMRRRARIAGEDGMVRFDAEDERKRYDQTMLGDHVKTTQKINVAKARTRAALIWFPGAYLLGLFAMLVLGG